MVIIKPYSRLWLFMLLLACFLLPVKLANAALTASVDRTVISNNDMITLTIRSDTGPIEHTDFSALEKNFSVINRQRSNQITIINGDQQANYDLTLTLFPKTEGILTIPAFTSQGESSQPIQIKVAAGATDDNQSHGDVFLETEVSKPTAYVQEQLMYTLRLFHAVGLSEAQLSPLEVKNAVVQEIGDQKKYQTVRNGIRYSVIEKHYSISAQQSGQLTIPELTLTARTAPNRSIYGQSGQYVRSRSTALTVDVLPKPASYPSDQPWLPTSALYIADSWHDSMPTLTVGEPVTRTLTLTAINLDAAQLPDLKLPSVTGLKMYPDQVQDESNITAAGLVSNRSFSTAIVPTKAGEIEIPAIKVLWWNTDHDQLEETVVPAKKFTVIAAANATTQTPISTPAAAPPLPSPTPAIQNAPFPQGNSSTNGIWPYLTGIFALLWLISSVMWWRTKQSVGTNRPTQNLTITHEQDNKSIKAAYKAFKKACQKNDAASARQMLIDWFRLNSGKSSQQTLSDICQYYSDEQLTTLIGALENSLYGDQKSQASWQGAPLLASIEALEKVKIKQLKGHKNSVLKPLYPI